MILCLVAQTLNYQRGYGRYAITLIRGLVKKGFKLRVLILDNEADTIPKDLVDIVFPVLKNIPTSPLINPIRLYQDYRKIREYSQKTDAIHFLTESHLATTVFGYNKPYIVTTHGTWAVKPLNSNIMSRLIFSRGYKKANIVVSISNYTKKRILEQLKLNNIKVIYNGINYNLRYPKKFKSSTFNFLSVGALDKSKGFEISLRAICKLNKKHNIKYTIVSGKKNINYEEKLREIADHFQYNNLTIKYQIPDKELEKEYENADIFILTPVEINNDFEGFGLIFVEAMAAGLPIIASDSGAISEIVLDGITGYLAQENNVKDTETKINKMIDYPEMRSKLVKNAQKYISNFAFDVFIQEYINIYKEL